MSRHRERAVTDHVEHEVLPMIDRGELTEAMAQILSLAGEDKIDGIRPILFEAEDLLRSRLSSEAVARLNLIVRPKFYDIDDCARAYDRAMKETRANRKAIAP